MVVLIHVAIEAQAAPAPAAFASAFEAVRTGDADRLIGRLMIVAEALGKRCARRSIGCPAA